MVSLQQFSGVPSPARGELYDHEPPHDQLWPIPYTFVHPIRYDFFYKNGVPRWRGTGYYYARFRPGVGVSARLYLPYDPRALITFISSTLNLRENFHAKIQTVLTFLVFLTTGLQYMVQRLNYAKDLERIERIRQDAKTTAWGNRLVPPEGQKKASVILTGWHDTELTR